MRPVGAQRRMVLVRGALLEAPDGASDADQLLVEGLCGEITYYRVLLDVALGPHTPYASMPGLIAYIQAGFTDDTALRRLALQRVPLLVLDDLGTEYVTGFSRVELGDLLNQRYNRELPTIITSNAWFEMLPVRLAAQAPNDAALRARDILPDRDGTLPHDDGTPRVLGWICAVPLAC
jgi:hypothetical protein